MTETVTIPAERDVRGTLDAPEADAAVVACPPHPQMGGSRNDGRLRAVADALDAACLRIDYGAWDEGDGERADAVAAVEWARERYDPVGLFGYSFGGGVALVAAAEVDPVAVSALAPVSTLGSRDVAAALDDVDCPGQVVYGERDDTADWEAVVERARERAFVVEALAADHFFLGQEAKAAGLVAAFLGDRLG